MNPAQRFIFGEEKQRNGRAFALARKRGMCSLFRRKSPFGVFFLPPAAFSLPRKEKGAETCLAHCVRERPPASFGRNPRAFHARGTIQPLFLCAAKKKPLAVKRKRQRGSLRRNKLHIPRPAASGRSRPFRCSSFSRTNRFAGFAREPHLWNPLKTTKKRADAPFLDHSRGLV